MCLFMEKMLQTLGDVAVDLTENALTPFSHAAEGVQLSSLFADSKVDVDALETLADSVSDVASVVYESSDTLNSLPEAHISKVSEEIDKVKSPLSEASDLLSEVEVILPYLPQMLGSDGQTRNYLLVAQNNSEIRATGGFPGSWMLITVTNGTITLGDAETLQGK